jgi:hypothetical protein
VRVASRGDALSGDTREIVERALSE